MRENPRLEKQKDLLLSLPRLVFLTGALVSQVCLHTFMDNFLTDPGVVKNIERMRSMIARHETACFCGNYVCHVGIFRPSLDFLKAHGQPEGRYSVYAVCEGCKTNLELISQHIVAQWKAKKCLH